MKIQSTKVKSLFKDPNVKAIWTENGKPVVGVARKVSYAIKVQGVVAKIVEVGMIHALKGRKSQWRPAPGGVSVGHGEITAGTLGTAVKQNNEVLILSNNHVLANSNDASLGDKIYQPGVLDIKNPFGPWPGPLRIFSKLLNLIFQLWYWIFGIKKFCIGRLYKFIPVKWKTPSESPMNRVDCALAKPMEVSMLRNDVLGLGVVTKSSEVKVGEQVYKSGRTSEVNSGTVIATDSVVEVSYGSGRFVLFENQIMTTHMAIGGDSGSLLMNDKIEAVGLVYAGSNTYSWMNKIGDVEDALGGLEWWE